MPTWLETILNMLSQFTGGRGGIDNVIVNYGIAAIFYTMLFAFALSKHRENPQPRERLLLWGFAFGLSRELFMIIMATIQALGLVSHVTLHVIFPPLEHALLTISITTIAAAYLRFLLDDAVLARRYLQAGISVTLVCYLATFWWWAGYIQANPSSKFGQVWPDWVFHINASVWALLAAGIIASRACGWMCKTVALALFFFFISDFLKIPDMALGEVYENIFTPIARSFYFLAIIILGYVYVREMWLERQQHLHHLEGLVQNRTQALETALKDLSISNDKLSELSLVDQLTGLGNRRDFDMSLSAEWDRARREKTTLSLLLIDVDYFKSINDTHGHVAGDAWLRNIAATIKQTANRASDINVRYGGDEFAVILPNTNQEGALRIAKSICQAIANSNVEWEGFSLAGTVSVGVASMIPSTVDGLISNVLTAGADSALYQAKANGRNQVST